MTQHNLCVPQTTLSCLNCFGRTANWFFTLLQLTPFYLSFAYTLKHLDPSTCYPNLSTMSPPPGHNVPPPWSESQMTWPQSHQASKYEWGGQNGALFFNGFAKPQIWTHLQTQTIKDTVLKLQKLFVVSCGFTEQIIENVILLSLWVCKTNHWRCYFVMSSRSTKQIIEDIVLSCLLGLQNKSLKILFWNSGNCFAVSSLMTVPNVKLVWQWQLRKES